MDPGLAEALAAQIDGADWSPGMRELSDRQKAWVLAYCFFVKPGRGSYVAATKLAGFGTATSSAKSWSTIASRIAQNPKILAALHEQSQKYIHASAPHAVQALVRLIHNPKHKDHARAIAMLLERTHPAETTHRVKVEHETNVVVASADVLRRISELARAAGLDSVQMPPTIDATCEEVTDG